MRTEDNRLETSFAVPFLQNPRHERFAQLVASGIRPQDAYVAVGYSKNGAHQSAGRMLRSTSVKVRVAELQAAAVQSTASAVQFDHDRVLARLDLISRKAFETNQLAVAVRCEELIGRSRGLFIDRSENTAKIDLNNLTSEQRDQLIVELEKVAFENDPKGLEEWRAGAPKPPKLPAPQAPTPTCEAPASELEGSSSE